MIYRIANQQGLIPPGPGIVNASLDDFLDWSAGRKLLQTDIENTYQRSNQLLTLQVGNRQDQWVFDGSQWNVHSPAVHRLRQRFSDPDTTFLLHNAKHDLKYLRPLGFRFKVWDTFLAECLLTAGLRETDEQKIEHPLGLDDLVLKYLNLNIDKGMRANLEALFPKEGLSERITRYCATDVRHLEDVMLAQMQHPHWNLIAPVVPLENMVVSVFAQIELNGVPIDRTQWTKVADLTEQMRRDSEAELDQLVLTDPKLTHYRPPQTQGGLFEAPKMRPVIYKPKQPNYFEELNWGSAQQKKKLLQHFVAGLDSTKEAVLARNRRVHPIFEKLLVYNKVKKLTESFGYSFLDHVGPNGRVHSDFWQILSTGRVSLSKPNMNQIPSRGELANQIRQAVVAPKGWKVVGGDYSGMELRIIADASQDPIWLDAFRTGKDLHSVLCAITFGISLADVKKPFPPKPDWSYRDVQKVINFGLAYGMSAYKLADTMQIPVEEADCIIRAFFAACPGVKKFLEGIGALGCDRGYICTYRPTSRPRFFELPDFYRTEPGEYRKKMGRISRQSKNHPIQGTNGDIIKRALILVQDEIERCNLPVQIILSVYDEIQTLAHESVAQPWKVKLEELMLQAAAEVIKRVPVKADCGIHDHWSK